MIGRLIAVLAAAVLVLAGCGSSNSGPTRNVRCGQSTNGVLCVVVYAGQSRISDVIGYYSPATQLPGRTWRLNLLGYNCDPASPTCRPAAQYPARARHTPPLVNGTCTAVFYEAGQAKCTSRLASAYASDGVFAGLPTTRSTTLAAHGWICMSAQVAQRGGWRDQFAHSAACYRNAHAT